MKTTKLALLLAFSLQPSAFSLLSAAPFDCGSTGAYGPMNITNDTTLQLPPDGILHCTTITVASGATLRFNRNALNTPVYLLATGDVTINGTVDVNASPGIIFGAGGRGGPGGFDGGCGASEYVGLQAGDGCGPGGGKRSGDPNGQFVGVYGNILCDPLIGGSGGVGSDNGNGGNGGGGAILIASNNRIVVNGFVNSHGACPGAIRLVAPYVSGNGTIDARPGWAVYPGRARIDCTDNQAYRSLTLRGLSSRGSRMIVSPAVIPALDIVEVAGNAIPQGTNNPAQFELPIGTDTNQTVRVQARNFTNDVPIRVVVTPENGPRGEFDAVILKSSGNPPFAIVPVVIPAGRVSQIHAWTR